MCMWMSHFLSKCFMLGAFGLYHRWITHAKDSTIKNAFGGARHKERSPLFHQIHKILRGFCTNGCHYRSSFLVGTLLCRFLLDFCSTHKVPIKPKSHCTDSKYRIPSELQAISRSVHLYSALEVGTQNRWKKERSGTVDLEHLCVFEDECIECIYAPENTGKSLRSESRWALLGESDVKFSFLLSSIWANL